MQSGESGARRVGITPAGAATVLAVVLVVIVVSLPRLHAFAIGENEADAAALTRALGAEIAAEDGSGADPWPTLQALVERSGAARRGGDLEWLEGGRLLRRHGYLFELGRDGLYAWPWAYGDSGRAAFVFRPEDGILRHANAEGLWTGPDRPPALFCAGWSDAETALEPSF